ncbi:MAG TPA: DnaJ domain-containing protein, partial [Usitatibacter sp.]|nr:DnaJ domain-containing protein [Usitatibacter sp.]
MATGNKTFYEILGVGRDAKAQEIDRAYARLRSEMQKESSVPNPRLAAMAKVAYETLSDPQRREEYDDSIGILKRPLRAPR